MGKLYLISIFSLLALFSWSQGSPQSYMQCCGSMSIMGSNTYKVSLNGSKKTTNGFSSYSELSQITSGNQIWLSFVPPENGTIEFVINSSASKVKFAVFEPLTNDVCHEIIMGDADLKRKLTNPTANSVGLRTATDANFLSPLRVFAKKVVYLVIVSDRAISEELSFDFKFRNNAGNIVAVTGDDGSFSNDLSTKLLDYTDKTPSKKLHIKIRDAETNKPVIANVSLDGLKGITGLYVASDIKFNLTKDFRLDYKTASEGYFFSDSADVRVLMDGTSEVVIKMEKVRPGKKMQIDDVQFVPDKADIMPNGEGKLKRLAEFLLTNEEIEFEIQGHVHAPGKNTPAAQRMSEARAEKVMEYFISQGVAEERLSAVGFGNTKPIFTNPKNLHEEQRNRRVEIVVK